MKCPYCDDNIHPMAKFCPKCGLPLKEDQTVQGSYGSYLVDDSGPNPWVIAGGALGIVIVAVSIGWMTGNGRRKSDTTVQRQPVAGGARSAPVFGSAPQITPLSQASWGGGSSSPSANYSPTVRWAYTPPPVAPRPAFNPAALPVPAPELPPPNMGVLDVLTRQAERPVMMAALPPVMTVPLMPELPPAPVVTAPVVVAAPVPAAPTAAAAPSLDQGAPPMAGREDPRSSWVYDPVHEQWVIRGDRPPRTSGGFNRGGAPLRTFSAQ